MDYNPQIGNNVTSVLGLILSQYDDQEHREYNYNWWLLNFLVNGGVIFDGVAPIPGQVFTVAMAGSPPTLQASWQTPHLPHTFVPDLAGSPPEYEYLTGYDATTGLFSSTAVSPGGVVSVNGHSGTVALQLPNTYTADAGYYVSHYDASTGNFGETALPTIVVPQTFSPVATGSPAEYEYLTGYNATTGLFSATTLPATATAGNIKTARIDMGTIASATPSLVTTYTWPTSFGDNNYTITGSVVILETPPAGAATEIITVSSIELATNGTGFSFVVCNAGGGAHHVIANFIAVHD